MLVAKWLFTSVTATFFFLWTPAYPKQALFFKKNIPHLLIHQKYLLSTAVFSLQSRDPTLATSKGH